MPKKLTYAELEQKIKALEQEAVERLKLESMLRKGRKQYQFLYEFSPIALAESDCTRVKNYVERLKRGGVKDFRNHFKDHPEAVIACMEKFKVLHVNKAMVTMLEAKNKAEIMGGFGEVFSDESFESFRQGLISYAEGKDFFESEVEIKTFKGRKRHLVLQWSFVPGFEDLRTRMLGSLVDITDRRRAEEELRKFMTISDASQIGNTIVDLKGNFLYVNRAFAEMHGRRPKELLGKHLSIVMAEDEEKKLDRIFQELLRKGKLVNVEVSQKKKDETQFPVLVNASVIRDEKGTPLYLASSTVDITDRKEREKELERSHRNLEEANVALRVVIENNQKQQAEFEEKVLKNVKQLIRPLARKLKESGLITKEQKAYLDKLESILESNAILPSVALVSKYPNLSPTEIQIANLIKEGKKTREIAKTLNLSTRTIEVHRNKIRSKLGLKNEQVNLQTFLLST